MSRLIKPLVLLGIGGLTYVGIELLYRGHSHWTMFFVGGIAGYCIGLINEIIPWEMPLWKQTLIGTAIVTVIEFIAGCIINLWLKWDVWDCLTAKSFRADLPALHSFLVCSGFILDICR